METLDPKLAAISQRLGEHYSDTFQRHSTTPRGVDWGREEDVALRYQKMLEVISPGDKGQSVSLLDVGCGYGGLLDYAKAQETPLNYTGIDISQGLIDAAKIRHPGTSWIRGDVLSLSHHSQYDYVVCNGILTQKLNTDRSEMKVYSEKIIRKLFELAKKGAAFNTMSTFVNFQVDNLFYWDPSDVLSFCLTECTHHVRLEHSYPLYEYTVYLYRAPQIAT